MRKNKKSIFMAILMLGLAFPSLVNCQTNADKNKYYVSLIYFKEGGKSSRKSFQIENEFLLRKHNIKEVRAIEVTGAFEIHGINDFIAQPNQIVIYSGDYKNFERYKVDKRMEGLHSIMIEGYEKYLLFWGDMENDVLTNNKTINDSTKIFNTAFVSVKDGKEADITLFKEKLAPLSLKYGLGSTHTIRNLKRGALLGENIIEIPTSIEIWYFDTNNNNGGIEGYLKDAKYKDIAPIRINSTSIWGSFQGTPKK
jgi:hypothetical protein